MTSARQITAVLLLATGMQASQADGLYANAHDLMVQAIHTGEAAGVMTGDIARKFADQFQATGPLLVTARVERRFRQAGCARVAVNFTQRQVPAPGGPTEALLDTRINYCLDGRAPDSLEDAP